jgi:PAS domain S-box-containing protein
MLQQLLDLCSDAILIVDADQKIVASNRSAGLMLGYGDHELEGQSLAVLVPHDFRTLHMELLRHHADLAPEHGLTRVESAMQVLCKDGAVIPAQVSIGYGEEDGRRLMTVVLRDLSAERERSVLAHLTEENPNPLIRFDLEGKVLFANPSGRQLLQLAIGSDDTDVPASWKDCGNQVMREGQQVNQVFEYGENYLSCLFVPVAAMGYVNVYVLDVTARMKVEKELELWVDILESVRNLVVVSDSKGLIQYVSPSLEEILGYEPADALGEGWWNIVRESGEDVDDTRYYVQRAAAGEVEVDPRAYEHRLRHKDGSWRWVSMADAKGPQDLLIGIVTDISDLKRVQGELTAQRDFAQQLMMSMGQGLTVTTSEGRFEYINPAYARMLSRSPDELVGRSPLEVTFPEDHAVLLDAGRRRTLGETNTYEARLRDARGGEVYALITGVPRYRDGQFNGSIAVVTDLTERRQMEQSLRKREESIRALYEIVARQVPFEEKMRDLLRMGISHYGLDIGLLARVDGDHYHVIAVEPPGGTIHPGLVIPLDQTICSHMVITNELLEIQHASASPWATHPCCVTQSIESYLGAPVMVGERLYGTLSFSSREPHSTPFNAADKDYIRLMAQWVGTEIERQESTRRLRAYAEEIERKNRDLVEARDRALEASRMKSVFLATMSHEIRTPMNAIIGVSELMLDSDLQDEQHEFAGIISQSAHALLTLLNDILDFSKIEAGRMLLNPGFYDPRSLARDMVELFTPRVAEKGLELQWTVDERVPRRAFGDATRLRQVLGSLIGNAVKFTDRGSVSLRLGVEGAADSAGMLRFEVRDTGIGISDAVRHMLFEPFTQADATITRRYGGSGLGLAISRRLVELMQGRIGFESVEGQGALFWFDVPLEPQSSAPRIDAVAAPDAAVLRRKFRPTKPVLLIEDNAVNAAVVSRQLRSLGLNPFAVDDGEKAVELLKATPEDFSLALMDVQMPVLDGLSAVRLIREGEAGGGSHLTIIAMTAGAMGGEKAACLEAGMDDYLSKPISLVALDDVLSRWLPKME